MRNSSWKFNSWAAILLMLLHTVLIPLTAWAQEKGQGVEIRVIAASPQEVTPGRILSFSVQVAQSTEREEMLEETLVLPEGWQAVTPPAPFTLPSGERTVRILAVLVPATAPAGEYEIGYIVRSRRDYALQDRAAIAVKVLRVRKLAFVIEEKPDSVIAGETYRVQLRLLNHGNAPVRVTLRAVSNRAGFSERVEPAAGVVLAGQSLPVVVTGVTAARARQSFTHYVQVIAEPSDNGQRAVVTYGIEVIPLATAGGAAANLLPTRLNLRLTGNDAASGMQAIWEGAGDLDDSSRRRVEFLMQGPDRQSTSTFGLRDELRLNYFSPDADLRLGDQSYGLSSLTDVCHYGRGVGADFRLNGGYGAGAYLMRERWGSPRETVKGAYLSRKTGFGMVKMNYALRAENGDENRLWSAELDCPLVKRTADRPYDARLSAEFGRSAGTRAGVAADQAYRAELAGSYGRDTSYLLRVLHAGPDYRGYYRDSDYRDGGLLFPVSGRVRGNLHYATWRQNLLANPANSTAPEERLAQLAFSYKLSNGYSATLGYSDFRRLDLLHPDDSLTHERPFRVGLARSAGPASWNAEYFIGDYRKSAPDDRRTVNGARLYAAYRPSPARLFTLFGGWRSEGAGGFLLGSNTHLGASVTWRPTDALEVSGWYTSYNLNDAARITHQGELTARYRLPGDRAWELRVLTGKPAGSRAETNYLLSYSVPIGLSLPRKKSIGEVSGRIYDARLPDHPGIPKVIVRLNNQAAVTDRKGRFAFTTLQPGNYSLTVDQKSISLGRITLQAMPLWVSVTGGKTTEVNIGVLPAARLAGSVMLRPTDWQRSTADQEPVVIGDPYRRNEPGVSRGLPNLVIELSNGCETQRRITDSQGAFTFDRLQPGRWHVKVVGNNLPAYYHLETAEMDVALAGDGTAEVTFNVLPLKRRIKMLATFAETLRVETKDEPK